MRTLVFFLISLPMLIFFLGLLGVILWQKNLILIIVGLEISFIASNVGFVLNSIFFDDVLGFIFSLTSLTLAGAEVSLGLTLAILMYRKFDTIFTKELAFLKA